MRIPKFAKIVSARSDAELQHARCTLALAITHYVQTRSDQMESKEKQGRSKIPKPQLITQQ
jgi:hypothetical protein